MDPDVAYDKIVEALNDYEAGRLGARTAMAEVTEHWEALDGWLRQGGFAPRSWDPARQGKGKPQGWELRQVSAVHYTVSLNGKHITDVRYDGRGAGSWGFYMPAAGYERHPSPALCLGEIQDRYEGKD
jgi:hypothetical protein